MDLLLASPVALGLAIAFLIFFGSIVFVALRKRKRSGKLSPPPPVSGLKSQTDKASTPTEMRKPTTHRIRTSIILIFMLASVVAGILGGVYFVVSKRQQTSSFAEISDAVVWVSNTPQEHADRTTEVEIRTGSENLDEHGNYSVVFSFAKGPNDRTTGEIQLLVAFEKDMCPEPDGQARNQSVRYTIPSTWDLTGYCFTPWMEDQYELITLNEANNFQQEVTVNTQQENALSCGSFQTDVWILELNGSESYSVRTSRGRQWDNNNCRIKRLENYQLSYQNKTYTGACMINAWGNLKTHQSLSSCEASAALTPTLTPSPTTTPAPCSTQCVPTDQCPEDRKTNEVCDQENTVCCAPESATPTPTGTITPTLTPTPPVNQCQNVKVYDDNWNLLTTDDLKDFVGGQSIRIAVVAPNVESVSKGRIRVKEGDTYTDWSETSDLKSPAQGEASEGKEFFIQYQLPQGPTEFTIEAEIFDNGIWR